MLTCEDRTREDALAVHYQARNTGLRHMGFKDLGLPFERLEDAAAAVRSSEQKISSLDRLRRTRPNQSTNIDKPYSPSLSLGEMGTSSTMNFGILASLQGCLLGLA